MLTIDEGVATIRLDRQRELNRLTVAALSELEAVLHGLGERVDLKALIITGAGGVFSVGADLHEIAALDAESALEYSRLGQRIFGALGRAAPLSIAAIDGHCLGGGFDLALHCSLRYASPGSTFRHPGPRRGIITGWGGTQLLPRLIGEDAALRFLLLGDPIDAAEALRLGMISGIASDPLREARRVAGR